MAIISEVLRSFRKNRSYRGLGGPTVVHQGQKLTIRSRDIAYLSMKYSPLDSPDAKNYLALVFSARNGNEKAKGKLQRLEQLLEFPDGRKRLELSHPWEVLNEMCGFGNRNRLGFEHFVAQGFDIAIYAIDAYKRKKGFIDGFDFVIIRQGCAPIFGDIRKDGIEVKVPVLDKNTLIDGSNGKKAQNFVYGSKLVHPDTVLDVHLVNPLPFNTFVRDKKDSLIFNAYCVDDEIRKIDMRKIINEIIKRALII